MPSTLGFQYAGAFAKERVPFSRDRGVFSEASERTRLSSTATKAFIRLALQWKLTNSQAATLFGVSQSTWERIKRGRHYEVLSQDQLTRVSALLGIFEGLYSLFTDETANLWLQSDNSGPIFAGKTPLEVMIEGGIPAMLEVRRYIDAVRGGL
jgi:hypothetical protein